MLKIRKLPENWLKFHQNLANLTSIPLLINLKLCTGNVSGTGNANVVSDYRNIEAVIIYNAIVPHKIFSSLQSILKQSGNVILICPRDGQIIKQESSHLRNFNHVCKISETTETDTSKQNAKLN